MDWQNKFYEFIAEWMRFKGEDVKKIVSVYEEAWEEIGGCPTCGGGIEYEVYITWIDSDDKNQGKTFKGQLSELFW